MAQVVIGSFVSLAATQRDWVSSWSFDAGTEIKETRPFTTSTATNTAVNVDAGLKVPKVTIHVVDDTSKTGTNYLMGAAGTKVAIILRPNNAAQSATNFSITGNVLVVEPPMQLSQGEVLEYDITLSFDGGYTYTAS